MLVSSPTYQASTRVAELLLRLLAAGPHGLPVARLSDGYSDRTLWRYLATLTDRVLDPTTGDVDVVPLEAGQWLPSQGWIGVALNSHVPNKRVRIAPALAARLTEAWLPRKDRVPP